MPLLEIKMATLGEESMNITPDYHAQRELERRELEKQADELLQSVGYTVVGLPRRAYNRRQAAFERLQLRTPTGGKQGWRLR